MWVSGIQVRNYKSFSDSGLVSLGPKFNVILGQNNSGKSALLESLKTFRNENNPHRDLMIRREAIPDPISIFGLEVHVDANEIFDSLMNYGNPISIPIASDGNVKEYVQRIFEKDGVVTKIQYSTAGVQGYQGRPSHGFFEPNGEDLSFQISPTNNRQNYTLSGVRSGQKDTLGELIPHIISSKIFVFEAERVNLSVSSVTAPSKIQGNAGNLARALLAMSEQPILWEEFNLNVNRILPNVKRVVPSVVEGSSNVEIRLWPVDPKEQRPDLMVSLARSGTGVGQVLAILCAAMTVRQAVIGVDEPSNFLHPGAVKALFAILAAYDHQYVVTTHSLDVLAAVGDVKVYMTKWADCITTVHEIKIGDFREHKAVLGELGVSLYDVLGMETILWVEGETEEICIPRIVQKIFGYLPGNIGVVRVRSASELADKKRGAAFWDVYRLLSSSGGSVPANTRFLFDRETRSTREINDISRASEGEASFLSRRTFENYLIGENILIDEINSEAIVLGKDQIDSGVLNSWLSEHAARFSPAGTWLGDSDAIEWKSLVDAPAMLNAMFKDLLNSEYRKVRNSPSLTSRLLASGGKDREELESFISGLLKS